MLTANMSNCSIATQIPRNSHNELVVVDEHGNTVGMLVSNDQAQFNMSRNNLGLHLKYPVPCSKLANVTIDWLKENFEENQWNSLPRSIMFEEYSKFCFGIDMKPFNQAVFGKIVRACFPNLTTRRLGVRGQSRYHYSGLGARQTSIYWDKFQTLQEKRNVVRACTAARKKNSNGRAISNRTHSHKENGRSRQNKNSVTLESLCLFQPEYPTLDDIDIKFDWKENILGEFLNFYYKYNMQLLNCIISLNLEQTMVHLRNFPSYIPRNCRSMMVSENICHIITLYDDVMYEQATSILLPDCLAALTTEFNVAIRKYAKTLRVWMEDKNNYDDNMSESVMKAKVRSARVWSEYVVRVTTLCHVTKEARKTLVDPGIVAQLLCALRNLSINDTVEQCSYAGCYDYDGNPGKILDKTCYDRKKTKELVIQFSKLLEKMACVERFAALLENIIDTHGGLLSEPNPDSPDHCFEVITPKTRLFMLKWSFFTSKMHKEITLRTSGLVGVFQLVKLLFGDYVNHVICLRQERANRIKRQRDILKRDSRHLCKRLAQIESYQKDMRSMSAFAPIPATSNQVRVHSTVYGSQKEQAMKVYNPSRPRTFYNSYIPPTNGQIVQQCPQYSPNMLISAPQTAPIKSFFQPPTLHSINMPGTSAFGSSYRHSMQNSSAVLVNSRGCSSDANSFYVLPNTSSNNRMKPTSVFNSM